MARQNEAAAPMFVAPGRVPSRVPRSSQHGRRRFSTRTDYEAHLAVQRGVTAPDRLWEEPGLVAGVQRDWHAQGQTSCLFARNLARTLPGEAWPSAVVLDVPKAGTAFDAALAAAIESPEAQLLSVLFPAVAGAAELVELLDVLARGSRTLLAGPSCEDEGLTILRLRAVVTDRGAVAWILAFGPFGFWPATRRGPVMELVIRTKPKPERIFRRLDQDRRTAHLADAPISMADEAAERMWHGTRRAAREILGGRTGVLTSPEATLCLPSPLVAELPRFRSAERA